MSYPNAQKYPEFRKKLRSSTPTLGAWITLSDPKIAEIFGMAGFDWVLIDLEHSGISITTAEQHLRLLSASSATTLCRPTTRSVDQMRRLMDAGADGFILPMTHSVSDIEHAMLATRYPPEGMRGMGLHPANNYGMSFDNYYKQQKHNPILIAQIEDEEGIENLSSIAAHNACDGIFLGPYDLSLSLGCPGDFDNPSFLSAIGKVEKITTKHDKPLGIHVINPIRKDLDSATKKGFQFIACSLDTKILLDSALSMIGKL
jgi:2-dehydro-3-deoxyglucarate aldolase